MCVGGSWGFSPGKFLKPIKEEKSSLVIFKAILPSVNEQFQRRLLPFIVCPLERYACLY